MPTIAYHTLGCKVNQYETEKIREALELAGFQTVPFSSRADAYVINTCSVTGVADSKSRAVVRKALRLNPNAYVVVTGCYADLEPGQVEAIEGVDLVVPTREKSALPERLMAHFEGERTGSFDRLRIGKQGTEVTVPRSRTRAVVKVQDGCDQFCSYCVVPYARSRKWSRPIHEVLSEIESLAAFGYKEIVLTGIRLGSYRHEDRGTRSALPNLIIAAADVPGIERVRLSSIEQWEIDDSLLNAIQHPKVCRHLHIPLQSGDDGILQRMNRPYTGARFLALVERVRELIPGAGITTDVMVGFPGESDEEFANTCRIVEQAAFSRLHVFRYSPRNRTPAATMPGQVSERNKKLRADMLLKMGRRAVRGFAEAFLGETLSVLIETRGGFADNYIEVRLPGDKPPVGEVVPVRIIGVDQDGIAIGSRE